MNFRSYDTLQAHRPHFLALAISDVKKWCVLPDQRVEKGKQSDQYWLRLFSADNAQNITPDDARKFLITFKLIRASWETAEVAKAVREVAAIDNLSPIVTIARLTTQLKGLNKLKRQQTSAASKIVFFSHPKAKVYIWDALATKSARVRDNNRLAPPLKRVNLGLYTSGSEHDYAAFHRSCAQAHADEMENEDFKEAVRLLDIYFQNQGGQLANRDKIPLDFVARRLLDKFMFWEGWAVDRCKLPE